MAATFANGDRLGARVLSSGQVNVYRNATLLGTWSVGTWSYASAQGYIGIYCDGAGGAFLEDFGGGTVVGTMSAPSAGEVLTAPNAAPKVSLLKAAPAGARYLQDATGMPSYLAGAFTWSDLVAAGAAAVEGATFPAYLDLLAAHNQNFVRLWTWEQAPWMTPSAADSGEMPYVRTGSSVAIDGKVQYDLTQFNQPYFDRLRQMVIEAQSRGIYASIVLFNGRSLMGNVWLQQPFNRANNGSGVDGDRDDDGQGIELYTLAQPDLLAFQDAYVRKVMDTVNDLDTVIYEVSDESAFIDLAWKQHMIALVKAYAAELAKQHPVGVVASTDAEMTALLSGGLDFASRVRLSQKCAVRRRACGDRRGCTPFGWRKRKPRLAVEELYAWLQSDCHR